MKDKLRFGICKHMLIKEFNSSDLPLKPSTIVSSTIVLLEVGLQLGLKKRGNLYFQPRVIWAVDLNPSDNCTTPQDDVRDFLYSVECLQLLKKRRHFMIQLFR